MARELTYIQLSELLYLGSGNKTQVPSADFIAFYIPIIFLIPLRAVIQNPPTGSFVRRFHSATVLINTCFEQYIINMRLRGCFETAALVERENSE